MPVAVHPGLAGSNPAISHYCCRATCFAVFCDECRWNYIQGSRCGCESRRCSKRAPWFNQQNASASFHRFLVVAGFPALAGWQRMPRVLHGVAGSSPASRKAVAQWVEQMCPFPCRCPQARPAPIDPANAGGTTGQPGRGFDSRPPQGGSSGVEQAACFTFFVAKTCRMTGHPIDHGRKTAIRSCAADTTRPGFGPQEERVKRYGTQDLPIAGSRQR